MIGNFGDAEVFSFHATKFVSCGEGGAIVTNNDDFAARVRKLRNFGFDGCDLVVAAGTNGKMSELAAAMGLTSLDSMEEFLAVNERNYRIYCDELAGIEGVVVLAYDRGERCNFQYLVLEIDDQDSALTRDQWLQVLHGENVLARRYFYPGVHHMEPYRSLPAASCSRLPATDRVLSRVLVLPTGTAAEPDDIRRIGEIFRAARSNFSRLRSLLPAVLPLPTVPLAPQAREAA